MLKTSESVEKSAEDREGLAFDMRAVLMHGDLSDGTVSVPRATLAVWARRVEECEWGDGVIRAPRDRNDVPISLGDHVMRAGDGMRATVLRITLWQKDGAPSATVTCDCGPWLSKIFVCDPCDLEHVPASPSARIREWVRRARADEHMDLRELDAIADDLDAEVAE